MTRAVPRSRLLAPLVHAAALLLLLEEWCWDLGLRLGARFGRHLARWPLLAACEARVRTLPPYAALCAFMLPGLLLFPVKLLALVAIAKGHAASGITTIVVAKLGGAAVVARLYALTLPTLLAVGWFARCHGWFMRLKARWIARLRDSAAYRHAGRLRRGMKLGLLRLRRRMRARRPGGDRHAGRHASHLARVLRRFVVLWRARRRE
jgi:hypothetical protein